MDKRKNDLEIARLEIELILRKARACIYWSESKERLMLEVIEADEPRIEIESPFYED